MGGRPWPLGLSAEVQAGARLMHSTEHARPSGPRREITFDEISSRAWSGWVAARAPEAERQRQRWQHG